MTGKAKSNEAKIRASINYDKRNKEIKQYRNKKSATKNFILKTAEDKDIELVEKWLEERKNGNK